MCGGAFGYSSCLLAWFRLVRGQVAGGGRHLGLADIKRFFAEHLGDAALGWRRWAIGYPTRERPTLMT
jgi:hypothetical protein